MSTIQVAPAKRDRDLMSWWKRFQSKTKKEEEKVEAPSGIFGVPLQESIKYANVAISLTDADGKSFIYGYVPIVIAKCGVYLKEKATDVEGIFRLSGSAKRIKDLQTLFDSPDRYGKGLDWTGYTVHDAANILRRYLNQLPEPIVPLEFYERFRQPLRSHEYEAVGDLEAQAHDTGGFDHDGAIQVYQQLITELPPLNRQLLLYILDLLAVFASKSDLNRMTSTNLAAIFQPGMLSHPSHDMAPGEYRLSQDVLVFLIENQDHFLIGMRGTAADEETVREVQSGGTPQPSTPTSMQGRAKTNLVRSTSSASAGADSIRRYGGIRRNVSVSSKHSTRNSSNVPSPVSPMQNVHGQASGAGIHRSNTVPSKKSPAMPSSRFHKASDGSQAASTTPTPPAVATTPTIVGAVSPTAPTSADDAAGGEALKAPVTDRSVSTTTTSTAPTMVDQDQDPNAAQMEHIVTDPSAVAEARRSHEGDLLEAPAPSFGGQPSSGTPSKDRSFSNFFSRSPTSDTERKDTRHPNKLKKKRLPGSSNHSAQSSSTSLPDA
ncbi:MAG: hypothetical protein M1817_005996 [Caeruleum heppii]|nr:MAG: hypothetical protein M1817_005996 [Caeruleum heppii]